MNTTTAASDAATRLTPAVLRVLEWHRRRDSALQPRASAETGVGELSRRPPAAHAASAGGAAAAGPSLHR